VLWTRETESGRFDTPERRAGLEARINALMAAIGDEAVRRYYRADLWQRLRRLTAGEPAPDRSRNRFGTRDQNPLADKRRSWPSAGPRGTEPGALAAVSPRISASSIVRGSRSALPPREALILLGAYNHPWLLEIAAEELAGLEFLNAEMDILRRALLDIAAGEAELTRDRLRAGVVARDCGGILQRVESAIHPADWPAREHAAAEDVRQWWNHVLTLHHKNSTLNKELKEAERALGEELSEQNFARLRDVRSQLSALDGTEASIEGFGALSGRPTRGL
jgi:DNA primase